MVVSLLLVAVLAFAGTRSVDPASVETDPSVHVGALASPAESLGGGARVATIAETVGSAQTAAAANATDRVESAENYSFSWAVRDLNLQALSDRGPERKPISERYLDSDVTRLISSHPPAHSIARAASHGGTAPPRHLFYLHGALLI